MNSSGDITRCVVPSRDSVCTGARLQTLERAGLVRIAFVAGQVCFALLLDQHALSRQPLHHPPDDLVQHRMYCFVARRRHADNLRFTLGAAPVNPIEQQAVQVTIDVAGRAKSLNQRDRPIKPTSAISAAPVAAAINIALMGS